MIRALVGTAVMAVGLGVAGAVGDRWLTAVVCFAIVVPLILLLRRFADRAPLRTLGLVRPGLVVLGAGVTLLSAAIVFGAGTALGWLRWGTPDWPQLALFLLTNTVIAFLLEAMPEELVFRGYVFTALPRGLKFAGTLALFTCAALTSNAVRHLIDPAHPLTFAPAGEDPVAYAVLMAVFGITLLVARIRTGSLWTCVGLHLSFLAVNRVVLFGDTRGAGWSAELVAPDAVLLVPAYLLLTAVVLALIPRASSVRPGRLRASRASGLHPSHPC
ncbi:CPBP family intramembrane metalloprotease [Lentzea tibetensis]|uniref:CPBP family intramembrane metalloprotease n=1 Tax=Lentzea tibetensis TaxID=2591470 RepID=A0A563ER04_9PSEU|nr:CPBP family glutamic-type intramembrane protease [Lentzea tibetensis]TWP50090.1 CPBP family intramembrane metalloprotease [Lentzea tibetensis]